MPRKIDVDATTGNKLLRLFRKLMISHGKHYMSDLARELKCSPQTIGRLMLELETELGAQIESGMDSHKKWYKFTSRNSNNLGLDTEEIRYLCLCKDMAAPYLSEDISVHLDQLILKLAIQQLGEDRVEKEYPKIFEPDYSFYSKGQIDYSQHVNSIIKIERAIRESGILKLTYRSSKSNRKKHIYFAPKQFICHSSALYILGASVKDDLKTFEKIKTLLVHRIESVEKTDNKAEFVIPKSDTKDFGLPWLSNPVTFTITFKAGTAANYVKERIWCVNQKLKSLADGELELTLTTRSGPEVLAWCRGFGDRIKEVRINGKVIEDIMDNSIFERLEPQE